MKTTITAQQMAFFTKNGYIEFEGISFDEEELLSKARGMATSYLTGRDLWRKEGLLKAFWFKKIAPFARALLNKDQIRFGLDQWIPEAPVWNKPCPIKELFCIQGLNLGVILSSNPLGDVKTTLGIIPAPSVAGHVLFFKPELILDWPKIPPHTDLYLGAYAAPNAVYVQNLKDPLTSSLKQFGYNFGDVLKNDAHPLIFG